MKSPALSDEKTVPVDAAAKTQRDRHVLPSGRTVIIQADVNGEQIEIRSRDGDLEVEIELTENGPLLFLRGAKLQIESLDNVVLNCREFEVNTAERIVMRAQGGIDAQSEAEIL